VAVAEATTTVSVRYSSHIVPTAVEIVVLDPQSRDVAVAKAR
jgi:hypothetical protein